MAAVPLVISLVGYAGIAAFGRNGGEPGRTADIVLGWVFGGLAFAVYTVIFVNQTRALVNRRLPIQRRANLTTVLFLTLTYPFVVSLIIYGLYELDPQGFSSGLDPELAIVRLTRLWSLAALVQNGTGFTVVGPRTWDTELIVSLLAKYYFTVNLLVVSVITGRVLDVPPRRRK